MSQSLDSTPKFDRNRGDGKHREYKTDEFFKPLPKRLTDYFLYHDDSLQ